MREKAFSSGIRSDISSLGALLDSMMAKAGMLTLLSGASVRGGLSRLNARLVNEVLLLEGRLPEKEARTRLASIQKDAGPFERRFVQAGIQPGDLREVMAGGGSETRTIPRAVAKILAADFGEAFDLYPALVDRYGKLRNAQEIGKKLSRVDKDLFWQKGAFDRLQETISETDQDIEIDLESTVRMASGASDVFEVNETMKRLEASTLRKRAAVTAPFRASAWESIALASGGLATIGAVLYIATK